MIDIRATREAAGHTQQRAARIKAAREAAGLTQTQAAELVYSTLRAWQRWEATTGAGARPMHPAFWDLFQRRVAELQRPAGWD